MNVALGGLSRSNTVTLTVPPTIPLLPRSGTNLLLLVVSQNGFSYILQAAPQLPATNWTSIETNAGNGGTLTFTIPVTFITQKQLFRLKVQ
jgi:hypothetical protein